MSELNDLFWSASIEELKCGYVYEVKSREYKCLMCGSAYGDGIIYKKDEILLEARKAIEFHIKEKHVSTFNYLLGLNKVYTGISEQQKEMLSHFNRGLSDQEIMKKQGKSNTSTIRNHRFKLKEKKKQAKVFLAIMDLLDETPTKNGQEFTTVHKGATMIDERYITTQEEESKIISTYFSENGSLKTLPAKEKRKIIILRHISKNFKEDKEYKEVQINRILKRIYDDYPTLRRYLIEYGFLDRSRDCSSYWVK